MNENAKAMADKLQKARRLFEKSGAGMSLEDEIGLIQKTYSWDRHKILSLNRVERKSTIKFLQDVLRARNFG